MTDRELCLLCVQYGHWCRTRRVFAPAVPASILARLQPRRKVHDEPDGPLDPQMPSIHMAVRALAEEYPSEGICFALYYVHGFRPVKSLAAAMNIGRRTFYDRLNRHARRVWSLSRSIQQAQENE